MLYEGEYTIGTPEPKLVKGFMGTPIAEPEHYEEKQVKQTSGSSASTRVETPSGGGGGGGRLPTYVITVNVEVGYDPSSSETVIVAIYRGESLLGCYNCTFYPSFGVWHVAKNVRKFSIPIVASSEFTSGDFSVKVYDTSGNEKNVNYIELTTEVKQVA